MKLIKFPIFQFLFVCALTFSCKSHTPSIKTTQASATQNKIAVSVSNENLKYNTDTNEIPHLELPFVKSGEEVIYHTGYTLSYNEKHEQANWVAYKLTDQQTIGLYQRSNKFIEDPQVSSGSATDADYSHSGFDRGHLAPAADMSWSFNTMTESFYYSNMSPQNPSFNRGIWKKLEELVRKWANEYHQIFIVTGPVLEENLPTIGINHVSVPKYYYKVILDYSSSPKGIGFIIPNEKSSTELKQYAVSIDNVEKLTGIDFFYKLPDNQENQVEKDANIAQWDFSADNTKMQSSSSRININSNNDANQCKGITKKGKRCMNKTKDPSGYCHLHQNQM